MLEIRNVTRRFGDFTAVDNVSLTINTGEFFTLLGPSGCGKTTLLRMLAGFDQPDSGEIRLNGQDLAGVEPEKRPVHTVFQSYALFPHMSVAQNIAFPLKMAGVAKSEIDARVEQALKDVRLADKGGRMPTQLSGGQRQRVAIARALVNRPRLLLLDEPLSALDAKLREEMQIELINLQKDVGITFVYVTHDQGEALALSHRIAVMNQGRVEQLDAPETIYSFPRSRFVADFIGQCNPLDATVEAVDGERVRIDLRGLGEVQALKSFDAQPGEACVLTLRPEKIRLAQSVTADSDEVHFRGRVAELLYLGDVTRTSSNWRTASAWKPCCPTPRPAEPSSSRWATRWKPPGASMPAIWSGPDTMRKNLGKWLLVWPPQAYLLFFFLVPALIMLFALVPLSRRLWRPGALDVQRGRADRLRPQRGELHPAHRELGVPATVRQILRLRPWSPPWPACCSPTRWRPPSPGPRRSGATC